MSLPNSLKNGDCHNSLQIDVDDQSICSAPIGLNDSANKRTKENITEFLNGKSHEDALSVTLDNSLQNDDEIRTSHSEIKNNNLEEDKENNPADDESTVNCNDASISHDKTDERSIDIATPTITFFRPTDKCDGDKERNYDDINYEKLTKIIDEKDDEIKNLSKRLHQLELVQKTRKSRSSSASSSSSSSSNSSSKSSSSKSASSSSSSSGSKSSSKKSKSKEKKKPNKKTDKKKSKAKNDSKSKKEKKSKKIPKSPNVPEPVKIEENKNDSEPQISETLLDIEKTQINISEYRQKIEDLEQQVKTLQQNNIESLSTLRTIQENVPLQQNAASNDTVINQLIVDHNILKQELEQLKWQQSKMSQPTVLLDEISQLKKDISHLKKQNDSLKKYSRTAPSYHLGGGHAAVAAASSFQLTNATSSSYDLPSYLSADKTKHHYKSSDYILDHLNSTKRRSASTTPNVHSMLKTNIESLESPYYSSIQRVASTGNSPNAHVVPAARGYRTAGSLAASETSSTTAGLVDDPTPKYWSSCNNNSSYLPQYSQPRYDELARFHTLYGHTADTSATADPVLTYRSTDSSYVTVTTDMSSPTPDSPENQNRDLQGMTNLKLSWQGFDEPHQSKYYQSANGDLLSTQNESDNATIEDQSPYQFGQSGGHRGSESRNSRKTVDIGQPFTPKKAKELRLNDTVKFARPGGKMSVGRVFYIGHLPGRSEACVGLELDEDAGKHDGVFEGKRYFQCRKNRGVFISFHKIILAYKFS